MRLRMGMPILAAFLLIPFLHTVQSLGKGKATIDLVLEPQNVLATFPSEPCGDSVIVEWTAPPKDLLVVGYGVSCEAIDLSDRLGELVSGDVTAVVIGPLKMNSTYRCSVSSRTKLYGASKPVSSQPFSTTRQASLLSFYFDRCFRMNTCIVVVSV